MLKEPVSMVQLQAFCRRAIRKLVITSGSILEGSIRVDPEEECAITIEFSGSGKQKEKLVIGMTKERKKGGGKQKGDGGEREVSKLLSDWWGIPGSFYRSAGSGSRFTSMVDNREHPGDLTVPTGLNFCVEIKRDERFDLDTWLRDYMGTSFICEALMQATAAGQNSSRWPILVGRRNYYPWMIILPHKLFSRLSKIRFSDDVIARFSKQRYTMASNVPTTPLRTWVTLELEQLFSFVSPRDMMAVGPWDQAEYSAPAPKRVRGARNGKSS